MVDKELRKTTATVRAKWTSIAAKILLATDEGMFVHFLKDVDTLHRKMVPLRALSHPRAVQGDRAHHKGQGNGHGRVRLN